ncbi:cytochrome-c oxidase [Fredinandcohnia quinoae]|uniref:Cytochrome-c oxidase n=1 Tax=Fredinandcohnia quinoae TaxID=2918902 RepID=A0AAW5E1H6_9BACI|nr:cytochrome-c oxidase [Fredinandcohnia sp. SECRCQ15]MCH1626188.1 cytochrome-c oxidase [Fredinandcohnia sp. SECRCQ15]
MGVRLIKISVVYFLIGVGLGMYMSMAHNYTLTGVHVHINLLGWASMGLAGIYYHLFPQAGESKIGTAHFWLHNIGLPIMMIGLAALVLGNASFEPVVAVGGTITTLGIILFVVNILVNVKSVGR